jgi:hypothetical protein
VPAAQAGCSSLQQAFAEREIPAEILGLAGLLRLPEIVEVLAYARAVSDPLASVALAKILLGPRYRVGYKDLARVAALAKMKSYALRVEDEEEGEATPFLFAEALEHLDQVERLSDEARVRLEEFRRELAELRIEARKPVGEFLGEIVRRTGLLGELDARTDQVAATAAKRNLAAFMDQVHAFEPVEGELTLRAFLDYVDTVERMDKQEWSPVQPSAEDSVKVMTIHAAKGLEFDNVFVPGMAKGLLPSTRIQHNPAERAKSMDFELRGDAKMLPRYDGVLKHFKEQLQAQEEYEERRTAYVALTRARKRLFTTGAHWYGENINAKEGGKFLRELAGWVMDVRHGSWDPGEDIDEETNPLLGYRERFVKDWPEPARPDDSDEVFPDGWRHAALDAVATAACNHAARAAPTGGARVVGELAAERRHHAGFLLEPRARTPPNGSADRWRGAPCRSAARSTMRGVETVLLDGRPALPRFSGPARASVPRSTGIERRAIGQAVLLGGRRDAGSHQRGARRRARQGRALARGVPGEPVRRCHPAPRRAAIPPAARGVHGGRTDRRRLRRTRRCMGGGGLEDWASPRRRRPTRGIAARPVAGRASRSESAPGITLTCSTWRRRGSAHPMGMQVVKARGGGPAIDRRGRVRSHPGAALHVLRLPRVLLGGQGVVGREGRERGYVVSRSICCSNVR